MSGIAGIFQRDGAPVDPAPFHALVGRMKLQGPDAQNIWTQDGVALGHTLLGARRDSTSSQPQPPPNGSEDQQPASLAGSRLTITADVRLDAREKLRAELAAANVNVSNAVSDAHLVLHTFALWGADCVNHLSGDFAFAIWDADSRALFCARDQFGIKPFYYALFPELFLFSNSLNALRPHPRISSALNEQAVADFLLFGLNCDNASTTFRDIQRLPPAHSLLVSGDSVRITRYWSVPTGGRIRCSRPAEYVENFLSVWDSAVSDRLDSSPTGILLSGGLDSAAVAATATKLAAQSGYPALRAFTTSNELLTADRDPQFAAEVASALGIPWESLAVGNVVPFEHHQPGFPSWPEPVDDPLFASLPLSFQKISVHSRSVLSGEGSDNLMHFEMWPYVRDLRKRGEWRQLASDVSRYAWRRPFPWRGLAARLGGIGGGGPTVAQPFPKWISPEFARRFDLPARWKAGQPLPVPPNPHPIHPTAVASLYLPQWTRMFELENPSVTNCPVEVRYPFLDLRMVEYLLAIPPFPWFFEKELLRRAMAGRVLDSVRLRPKTPLAGDPLFAHVQRFGPFGVKNFLAERVVMESADNALDRPSWSDELDVYINRSLLSPLHGKMTVEQVNQNARPFCFNFWLQSIR